MVKEKGGVKYKSNKSIDENISFVLTCRFSNEELMEPQTLTEIGQIMKMDLETQLRNIGQVNTN